jgi:hypothetical protein
MSAGIPNLPMREALVERAYEAIEKSGLGALADHVQRVRRALTEQRPTEFRMPYGIAAPQDSESRIQEGKAAIFLTQPQARTRFTHLVVTESTAQHFLLNDYRIGKDSQLLGEIDLTFFSMKYQENDFLSDLSRLRTDAAQVSQCVSLHVQRKMDGHGPKNFTGILWAEYDFNFLDA